MLLALAPSSDMAMASDKSSAFRVVVVVRTGGVFVAIYFHGDLHQGSIASRETS